MFRRKNTTTSRTRRMAYSEYSRILSAAVINRQFRQMLLNDPVQAVSKGYSGEKFTINTEEKNRLASIQANSLADFAAQLSHI